MRWFKKKVRCLVCGKKIAKTKGAAQVKYRYDSDKIGTAYICKQCADDLDKEAVEYDESL